MMRNAPRRGFTLVELMVVIGVIAVLASLVVANAQSSVTEARAVACEKNRTLIEDLEQKFEHDKGRPSRSIQELIDEGYVNRHPCPRHGTVTWTVQDPALPWANQALVCSIHGEKTRLRKWVAPATAGPDALLADAFDGPIAGNWTNTNGRYWQLVDGKYRAGTLSRRRPGQHRSFSGNESWTDYDVSVNAELLQGNGYGVYFRTTGTKKVDGYLLQLLPGRRGATVRMREVRNGANRRVFASTRVQGLDLTDGAQNVKIAVRGSTFTASVNGKEVLTGTNSKYATGAIGLRSNGRAVVDFDDVSVSE